MSEDVVVTGVGVVSPLGRDSVEFWRALLEARVGLGPIRRFDTARYRSSVGGEAAWLTPDRYHVTPHRFVASRAATMAVMAAREAVLRAGIVCDGGDSRLAVVAGTCQGTPLEESGTRRDDLALSAMHATCDVVADALGARGLRATVSTACAAGAGAIALGFDALTAGLCDIVVAGGADSLSHVTWAGFDAMRALDPQPCLPYVRSGGLNLGEGAAFVVLEIRQHAERRGARPLATLLGYGLSADAYHPTAPDPMGQGARLAVERALREAGLDRDDVDYVNGHGTGTPPNDTMEVRVVEEVFGSGDRLPGVTSTKANVGHTLGAAGAIEAVTCVLAVAAGKAPPPAGEAPRTPYPHRERSPAVQVALSNSFAFGGNNAVLAVATADRARRPRAVADRAVVVTGIGLVGGPGVGMQAWFDAYENQGPREFRLPKRLLEEFGQRPSSAAQWRRMDDLARAGLVAARLALADAGIDGLRPEVAAAVGLYVATALGPRTTIDRYEAAVRDDGHANPLLFANAALCAPAGHICAVLGLRGPTNTISSGGTSGIVALFQAAWAIRRGSCDTAIVLGLEGLSPSVAQAAGRVEGLVGDDLPRPFDVAASGTAIGDVAVALVLQARSTAHVDGVRPYARIAGVSMGSSGDSDEPLSASADDWRRVTEAALGRARVCASDLELVVGAGLGVLCCDRAEADTYADVVGTGAALTTPTVVSGWTNGASAVVGAAFAAIGTRDGRLPGVAVSTPLPPVRSLLLREPIVGRPRANALVSAYGLGGSYGSAVLESVSGEV